MWLVLDGQQIQITSVVICFISSRAHMSMLFIIKVKLCVLVKLLYSPPPLFFMLTVEFRTVSVFWACSSISYEHVHFWCPFIDPHLTTYHSNIGVGNRHVYPNPHKYNYDTKPTNEVVFKWARPSIMRQSSWPINQEKWIIEWPYLNTTDNLVVVVRLPPCRFTPLPIVPKRWGEWCVICTGGRGMMDEFIHWSNPCLLFSTTCDEILSWMIEIWMKHYLVNDSNCNIVYLLSTPLQFTRNDK